MDETAEVVVIGAGFAGAATAYHLTARGVREVIILEAEKRPGLHASGKNAALCFQLIEDETEARLAVEGTRLFTSPPPDLASSPLLVPHGSMLLAGVDGREKLAALEASATTLGVAIERLGDDEAVRRVPFLAGSSFESALFVPSDGVVDIVRLLEGYLSAAQTRGARLRLGTEVTAIRTSRGRIEAVRTTTGMITCHAVIDAAGPWAGRIGQLAGVSARTIAPRKRHIFRVEPERGGIDPSWPFVWHDDVDVYFRPERGGLLTSPCDAIPHEVALPEVDRTAEQGVRAKLRRAFPAIGPVDVVEARACLRTFSEDERFIVGPDPEIRGFYWAAALGGHGMSTSYGVGRLAAAAVLGEVLPEHLRFDPGRFGATG